MSLLVAVRVLTYNHDRYVRQCLESIQSQKTNFDFKVFIGEDSSTDNTLQICREFEINHPEKFVVKSTKENNILQNSLNNFDLCFNSGAKYIALLEGDDFWTDPLKLQKQVDFLEANQNVVVSGHDAVIINEKGEKIKDSKLPEIYKKDASERLEKNVLDSYPFNGL